MAERRPRIYAAQAAEIDRARGDVPFEPFVRRAINMFLADRPENAEKAVAHLKRAVLDLNRALEADDAPVELHEVRSEIREAIFALGGDSFFDDRRDA